MLALRFAPDVFVTGPPTHCGSGAKAAALTTSGRSPNRHTKPRYPFDPGPIIALRLDLCSARTALRLPSCGAAEAEAADQPLLRRRGEGDKERHTEGDGGRARESERERERERERESQREGQRHGETESSGLTRLGGRAHKTHPSTAPPRCEHWPSVAWKGRRHPPLRKPRTRTAQERNRIESCVDVLPVDANLF